MPTYKVSEIQYMCSRYANEKVKQFIYGRNWKAASNAIDAQIIQMEDNIETLRSYQQLLNNLKD